MSGTILVEESGYSGNLSLNVVFDFLNVVNLYEGINKSNKDLIRNNVGIDVESCNEYVADLVECKYLEKIDGGYVLTSRALEDLKSHNENNPRSFIFD